MTQNVQSNILSNELYDDIMKWERKRCSKFSDKNGKLKNLIHPKEYLYTKQLSNYEAASTYYT